MWGDLEVLEAGFEVGVVEFVSWVGDAGAGDESAHGVAEDDHAVEVAVVAFGACEFGGGFHVFAEVDAGVEPGVSGGVVEEPDLIVFAEPGLG